MPAMIRPQLARLRAGFGKLTQSELAKRTGITQKQISALETGKTKGIEFETLAKLCDFFGCTPADLLAVEYEIESPLTPEELAKARVIVERTLARAKAEPLSPEEAKAQFISAWDEIYQQVSRTENYHRDSA